MLKTKCVFVLLAALAAVSVVQGAVINFSGSGSSGTINPASLPWVLLQNDQTFNDTLRGVSVWGVPGLGAGNVGWPPANGQAIAFSITFNGLPSGVTIDQTADPTPTAFDDFTRFHNSDDSIIWQPTYLGGNSVTFDAPIGYSMPAGTQFYINIAFAESASIATKQALTSVDFTGTWTTIDASVPEPASLSLVGLALLGGALFARRRIVK